MRERYDRQLKELSGELIRMGEMICEAISGAVSALETRDSGRAREIIARDEEIDRQERLVESLCFKLLLSQQPVAGDLRMVSSALKMITDMERIGDHAADISEIELMLDRLPPMSNAHLREMAAETRSMLLSSLEAYVERDVQRAQAVIDRDDVVDDLFDKIRHRLIDYIREHGEAGEQAMDYMMIAKDLERIGDHAVNIAEWVEFSITGSHRREENEED